MCDIKYPITQKLIKWIKITRSQITHSIKVLISISEIPATSTIWHELFMISVGDMVTDIMNTFVLSILYSEWKEILYFN